MNYSESVQYLYGLGHEVLAAKYRLENIQILLQALGDPQHSFRSVLVAGTNGKGSVAAMLASILCEAGHRTGLYTSPHLLAIEERVRVGGERISQAEFASIATLVREASEALVSEGRLVTVPTFFEQVTAIGLYHFSKQEVELAVLEVGIGGRLDATNAVERILSIITPIDYDHQNILGETIEEIAAEKAAIIRGEARAVIARQTHAEALQVLRQRCHNENVSPSLVNPVGEVRLSEFGKPVFDYESTGGRRFQVTTALRGRHQAANAATAIEASQVLSQLGFDIQDDAIIKGLESVRWPGRLELIEENPRMLLDGAHNPAGAKVLHNFLRETWDGTITLIFAVMNDKNIEGIAGELFPLAEKIIFTRVDERRGARFQEVKDRLPDLLDRLMVTESVAQALDVARTLTPPDGLICVAGSLYLVGAVKKIIQD